MRGMRARRASRARRCVAIIAAFACAARAARERGVRALDVDVDGTLGVDAQRRRRRALDIDDARAPRVDDAMGDYNTDDDDEFYASVLEEWVRAGYGANAHAASAMANGALFRVPFGVVAVPKCYPNDCVARGAVVRRTPAKGWQRARDEILRTDAIEETRARWEDVLELYSILPMRDVADGASARET